MGGLFGGTETVIKSNKISDFDLNNSTYGITVPLVIGTSRISGNVLDWQDFTAIEHKTSQSSGKGGGTKTTSINYTYTVASAIGLCEGPATVLRIWNDKEITTAAALGINIYNGNYGQTPWTYMTSKHPEHALSYSGLCYVAGVWDLGSSGGLPTLNYEIQKLPIENDGKDVNPAAAVEYIVNDSLNGIGFGTGGIDATSINQFRLYANADDLLISLNLTDQKKAIEVIKSICNCANADFFWSQDKLKFIVKCDEKIGSFTPNTTICYSLTKDDFIEYSDGTVVKFSRKDSTDCYNSVDVEFTNRDNDYNKETATFKVTADVAKRGLRAMSSVSLPFIHTKERAAKIAQAKAYESLIQRNTYTFKLGWQFALLEPGDLLELTDGIIGLSSTVVQITEFKENATGVYEVTAVEKPAGSYSRPMYDCHQGERPAADTGVSPGPNNPIYAFCPPIDEINGLSACACVNGGSSWGGAVVYISENNVDYTRIGMLEAPAIYGYLSENISERTTTIDVNLYGSGTMANSESGTTLYIDDEEYSYTGATLIAQGKYRLTGVVRGLSGTEAAPHTSGSMWGKISSSFRWSFEKADLGKEIFVKCCQYNIFGNNLTGLEDTEPIKLILKANKPPDVTAIDVEQLSSGVRRYYWQLEREDSTVVGYRIKHIHGKQENWPDAIEVAEGLITTQPYETRTLRDGVHTVMIKAVNSAGLESANTATVIIDLGSTLQDNVLATYDLSANGWAAVTHNGVVDPLTGALQGVNAEDMWTQKGDAQWSGPDDDMWRTNWQGLEVSASVFMEASGQLGIDFAGNNQLGLQYRRRIDEDFWGNANDPFWKTSDTKFWEIMFGMWFSYSQKSNILAGENIDIKGSIPPQTATPPNVETLTIYVDVPDRNEHFENLAIPVEGLELPIQTPDYYTTAVHVDSYNGVADAQMKILTWQPCKIQITDSSGTAIAATCDVSWQGYVREVIE